MDRLRELVLDDPRLQAELLAIPDPTAFAARLVELGQDAGLPLTAEDVAEEIRAARAQWFQRWV
jgi:hypothetical protein